jgi:stage III sporulation protein AF
MAEIVGWVKSIVFVVLFASFLELLLPASGLRRFVQVVMGLLVMLVMIHPAIDLLQTKSILADITAVAPQAANPAEEDLPAGSATVAARRDTLALAMYKKEIARQIEAMVMATDGVGSARVAVELFDGPESQQGGLKKVTIYARPGHSDNDTGVNPVHIGGSSAAPEESLSAAAAAKIVNTVKEIYQLKDNQVEIRPLS